MTYSYPECHICRSNSLEIYEEFTNLPSITSDAFPHSALLEIGECKNCHSIVKNTTDFWAKNVAKIYENYQIYHQSDGNEKKIFQNEKTTTLDSRSDKIISEMLKQTSISQNARCLDIGTGSGAFLVSLSKFGDHFELWGQDLKDDYKSELAKIPNFKELLCCDLSDISGNFDLISLVHVLEHVVNPIDFLNEILALLNNEGILIVNVPNSIENPIDLVVYDHCTHFSKSSLNMVLQKAGYELIYLSDELIKRELVCFAIPARNKAHTKLEEQKIPFRLEEKYFWLQNIITLANKETAEKKFYIFGASLAGVWLGANLKNWRGCFIDEDPNKIGNKLLGKEIISINKVDSKYPIIVPLEITLSLSICEKFNHLNLDFIIPN